MMIEFILSFMLILNPSGGGTPIPAQSACLVWPASPTETNFQCSVMFLNGQQYFLNGVFKSDLPPPKTKSPPVETY